MLCTRAPETEKAYLATRANAFQGLIRDIRATRAKIFAMRTDRRPAATNLAKSLGFFRSNQVALGLFRLFLPVAIAKAQHSYNRQNPG